MLYAYSNSVLWASTVLEKLRQGLTSIHLQNNNGGMQGHLIIISRIVDHSLHLDHTPNNIV